MKLRPATRNPVTEWDFGTTAADGIATGSYPQPNVINRLFSAGTTGDAGDIFTSLDRFGRLEEVRWDQGSTILERVLYGYDRVGNRTWRDVLTPAAGTTTPVTGWDEKYTYDGLYQVTQRQRGNLNLGRTAISGTPSRQEDFAYDPAGNWLGYSAKAEGTITLDQRRAHNDLNQIGSLSTAGTTWNAEDHPLTSDKVEHDANGNMLLLPHGPAGEWDKAMKLTWDAWNRLVKTENAQDNSLIASYQYDGLWRRTVKSTPWETRHYYYNDQWRSIEEHIEGTGSARHLEQQHLWGALHRWQYHRRDRDTTPTSGTSSLNETHYALQDAMSITAIVNTSGAIVERYAYSAFGQRLITAPDGTVRTDSTVDWKLGFHVEFADVNATDKADAGLTNYGYRYYSPIIGIWINRDIIMENGGSNLYTTLSNSPLNLRDFLGLEDHHWFCQIASNKNRKGQDYVNAICGFDRGGNPFINIDRYTTSYDSAAHDMLQYQLLYDELYTDILAYAYNIPTECKCCYFLLAAQGLRISTMFQLAWEGEGHIGTSMHPWKKHGSMNNTEVELALKVVEACACCEMAQIGASRKNFLAYAADRIRLRKLITPSPAYRLYEEMKRHAALDADAITLKIQNGIAIIGIGAIAISAAFYLGAGAITVIGRAVQYTPRLGSCKRSSEAVDWLTPAFP
jgi:RHS repeat-associated protein